MTTRQAISPNPNIPCKPGWCLAYVNEAFGVRKVYGSATAAWEASTTQHRDRDFPAGCWVPVWFALANEPNGHVALLAPDGSVYSTSDLSNTPHHHPTLEHLISYYAYYGMPLTYRGWTEDVEGTPVIESSTDGSVNYSGTITPQEDDVKNEPGELEEAAQKVLRDNVLVKGGRSVAGALTQLIDSTDTIGARDLKQLEELAALKELLGQVLKQITSNRSTYYLKGDKSPEVYALDVGTGKLRHVQMAEFDIVNAINLWLPVPQAKVDALVAGGVG